MVRIAPRLKTVVVSRGRPSKRVADPAKRSSRSLNPADSRAASGSNKINNNNEDDEDVFDFVSSASSSGVPTPDVSSQEHSQRRGSSSAPNRRRMSGHPTSATRHARRVMAEPLPCVVRLPEQAGGSSSNLLPLAGTTCAVSVYIKAVGAPQNRRSSRGSPKVRNAVNGIEYTFSNSCFIFSLCYDCHKPPPFENLFAHRISDSHLCCFWPHTCWLEPQEALEDVSSSYRAKIESLGGKFTARVTKSTTHLIFGRGKDEVAARAMGVGAMIVNCKWVEDCEKNHKRMPETEYPVDSRPENLLGSTLGNARRLKSMVSCTLLANITFFSSNDVKLLRGEHSRNKRCANPTTYSLYFVYIHATIAGYCTRQVYGQSNRLVADGVRHRDGHMYSTTFALAIGIDPNTGTPAP
jgi:hypothetical protein